MPPSLWASRCWTTWLRAVRGGLAADTRLMRRVLGWLSRRLGSFGSRRRALSTVLALHCRWPAVPVRPISPSRNAIFTSGCGVAMPPSVPWWTTTGSISTRACSSRGSVVASGASKGLRPKKTRERWLGASRPSIFLGMPGNAFTSRCRMTARVGSRLIRFLRAMPPRRPPPNSGMPTGWPAG